MLSIKGQKMDRRSSFGNMMRKKFSDISNSRPQPKPSARISEKSSLDSASTKEYNDHLVKEKMALAKIVHEKNEALELKGIEIQKLRTRLLMMRLHNWNLAQSNSQMSAELSLGREKIKALQHDLVCEEALLKAKDLELKESEMVGRGYEFRRHIKSHNANRSRSSKNRYLGGTPFSQRHADKQAVGSNRYLCSRRRSASSRIQQEEPADIFYDIDYNTRFPIAMRSNSSDHGRLSSSSTGQPQFTKQKKVPRYKERPVNYHLRSK